MSLFSTIMIFISFHFLYSPFKFNSFEFCPGKILKIVWSNFKPCYKSKTQVTYCEFDSFGGGPIAHNNHAFLYAKYSEVEKRIFKITSIFFKKKPVFHPWGWGHEFILLHTKRCKSQNVVISSFQNRN